MLINPLDEPLHLLLNFETLYGIKYTLIYFIRRLVIINIVNGLISNTCIRLLKYNLRLRLSS